jgi:hypothetical protein
MAATGGSDRGISRGSWQSLGADRQAILAPTVHTTQTPASQRTGGREALSEPIDALLEIELLDGRLPLWFWAQLVVWQHEVMEGECWSWRRPLDRDGYGQVHRGSRNIHAHQMAWEALVGPLPNWIFLDHLCLNRSCVRPAHLEPVVSREITFFWVGYGHGAVDHTGLHPQERANRAAGNRQVAQARELTTAREVQGELFEHLCEGGGSRALEVGPVQFRDRRLPKRFWNSVVPPETPDGCWEWCGSRERFGYGRLGWAGNLWKSHRVSYTALVGPIPEGHDVHHICKNPPCVRPDHLTAVTRREHLQLDNNPIMRKSEQTHCLRGHAFTPKNTILKPGNGRTCRQCGADRERARRAQDPEAARERDREYMRDYRRRKAEMAVTAKNERSGDAGKPNGTSPVSRLDLA